MENNEQSTTVETEAEQAESPTVTQAVAHRLAEGYVAFRDSSPLRKGLIFAGVTAVNPTVGLAAAGGYLGTRAASFGHTVHEEIVAQQ